MRLIDADALEEKLSMLLDKIPPNMNGSLAHFTRKIIEKVKEQPCFNAPAVTPPNAPLTLEELREMNGLPVWTLSNIFPEDCGYRVIRKAGIISIEFTDGRHFSLTDYDKSWLAYCRKPEEGMM